MLIATVVFGDPLFDRMARVLEYSVAKNCPSATFVRIDAERHTTIKGLPEHCTANMHKQMLWGDVVNENTDEEIVLMDCDTLVLRDIAHVFHDNKIFDVAYTVRDAKARINAGVLFVRSTHATRRLFDKWQTWQHVILDEDERERLHLRLRNHGGSAQAALWHALQTIDWPLQTIELSCEKYNSVDQTWSTFSEETTCVLHVKGKMRRYTLMTDRPPEKHKVIGRGMRAWRRYEQEMNGNGCLKAAASAAT